MLSIGSLERLGFSGAPVLHQSSGEYVSARELGPWPAQNIGDDLALQEDGAAVRQTAHLPCMKHISRSPT